MAKVKVDLFIARRLGGGAEGSSGRVGGRGVVVRIATATVAVSIAVMIVAVAVIAGFRTQISTNITAFTGHLHIQALDYGAQLETYPITLDEGFEREIASVEGVRHVAPYALKTGIAKTDEATQGVVLKGVDHTYDMTAFRRWLREGTLPRLDDTVRHKDILLSTTTARLLDLGVDDRVEMLFVDPSAGVRRDRFRVCGLYSSGMTEMDERMALTDIANVRRLEGWSASQATGYDITLDNMAGLGGAEMNVARIASRWDTGEPALVVRSVEGDYPQLFDWLAIHDVNAAVIITIMIVVALVSMISALLIIVLERVPTIGILKTLGMTSGSLRRVFVIQAARIVVWGLMAGNTLGIGAALVQRFTGVVKLDEGGYFLSTVPIELSWWWIVALNVGTLAVIVGLLVVPTSIVGRISPGVSMRYQ